MKAKRLIIVRGKAMKKFTIAYYAYYYFYCPREIVF